MSVSSCTNRPGQQQKNQMVTELPFTCPPASRDSSEQAEPNPAAPMPTYSHYSIITKTATGFPRLKLHFLAFSGHKVGSGDPPSPL